MATKNFVSDFKSKAGPANALKKARATAKYDLPMAILRNTARQARKENTGVQTIRHGKSVKM